MARVPVASPWGPNPQLGVRRPSRAVSLDDARNPFGDADIDRVIAALTARPVVPGGGGGIPDRASGIVDSTLGGILGQGSLSGTERVAAEWMAAQLPPTAPWSMNQPKIAGGLERAIELVRPLALADVGVAGVGGSMMFPLPGLAPGAAAAAGKGGGGALRRLRRLFGGGDEAVSAAAPAARETGEAAGRTSRQTFRNIDDLSDAAQPAWSGGPTLYHGAGQDISAFTRMDPAAGTSLGGRSAMGDALYTTPNVSFATRYADAPNQAAIKHAEYFGSSLPAPSPGFVQNVRFTGEGAPRLLNYGAVGVADDAKRAVLETLEQMDDLLGVSGTRLWTDAELAPLLSKLDNPRVAFADIHGFAEGSVIGAPESSLRGFVEMVVRRNTPDSALWNKKVSTVMSRLRTRLRNAGYHGYVAPTGGGFHAGQMGWHGEEARGFGDAVAWFAPERDLTIVGSARLGS